MGTEEEKKEVVYNPWLHNFTPKLPQPWLWKWRMLNAEVGAPIACQRGVETEASETINPRAW